MANRQGEGTNLPRFSPSMGGKDLLLPAQSRLMVYEAIKAMAMVSMLVS
jgi:hypothetical protein